MRVRRHLRLGSLFLLLLTKHDVILIARTEIKRNLPFDPGQRIEPVVILSAPADVPERRPVESEG